MAGAAREVRLDQVDDAANRLDALARHDRNTLGSVRRHSVPPHFLGDLAAALERLPTRTDRASQRAAGLAADLAATAHRHSHIVRIHDRAPWLMPSPIRPRHPFDPVPTPGHLRPPLKPDGPARPLPYHPPGSPHFEFRPRPEAR